MPGNAKFEAAADRRRVGWLCPGGGILTEVVSDAEKLGPKDLRLSRPLELSRDFKATEGESTSLRPSPFSAKPWRFVKRPRAENTPTWRTPLIELALCRVAADKKDDAAGMMLRRAVTILEQTAARKSSRKSRDRLPRGTEHLACVRDEYGPAESALTRAIEIREKAFGPERKRQKWLYCSTTRATSTCLRFAKPIPMRRGLRSMKSQ